MINLHPTTPSGLALTPAKAVKPGTRLIVDEGFTCLQEREVVTVLANSHGDLFVRCGDGRAETHFLEAQLDAGGENYVGFWLAKDN